MLQIRNGFQYYRYRIHAVSGTVYVQKESLIDRIKA